MNYTAIQETLLSKFEEKRAINPRYSYRAFAEKLRISSGALSGIITGKRKISKKMALRLASELDLTNEEKIFFLTPFSDRLHPNNQVQDKTTDLEDFAKNYKVISSWPYLAILTLTQLDDFKSDPEWMAKKLGIKLKKLQAMLELLIELEFLHLDNGSLKRTTKPYKTTDDLKNIVIRNLQQQNLELAAKKLKEVSVEKRDYVAMTMAMDKNKIPYAKRRIRQFLHELTEELESGEKNEIYKLGIQLFPITNLED